MSEKIRSEGKRPLYVTILLDYMEKNNIGLDDTCIAFEADFRNTSKPSDQGGDLEIQLKALSEAKAYILENNLI